MPNYGGGPKCSKCGQSVYFNEERTALGQKYHVGCFKCTSCNKVLDPGNCQDHENALYCNPCHRKNFGVAGYGFGAGGSGLATDSGARTNGAPRQPTAPNPLASKYGGGAEKCPRCDKSVYHAEAITALGKKFHSLCLKCVNCTHQLDARTAREHENELYCGSCYARDFGPRGYGFGGGGAGLSMDGAKNSVHRERRTQPPPVNTAVNTSSSTEVDENGRGSTTTKTTTVTSTVTREFTEDAAAEAYMAPTIQKSSGAPAGKYGGAEKCYRCGNSVYHAERITGAGQVYHKQCYKCKECGQLLDSNKLLEKDGEIYCKSCYGGMFGPKGYGYGGGAGALTRTQ